MSPPRSPMPSPLINTQITVESLKSEFSKLQIEPPVQFDNFVSKFQSNNLDKILEITNALRSEVEAIGCQKIKDLVDQLETGFK